jgi:hypothetical protein
MSNGTNFRFCWTAADMVWIAEKRPETATRDWKLAC